MIRARAGVDRLAAQRHEDALAGEKPGRDVLDDVGMDVRAVKADTATAPFPQNRSRTVAPSLLSGSAEAGGDSASELPLTGRTRPAHAHRGLDTVLASQCSAMISAGAKFGFSCFWVYFCARTPTGLPDSSAHATARRAVEAATANWTQLSRRPRLRVSVIGRSRYCSRVALLLPGCHRDRPRARRVRGGGAPRGGT